MKVHRGVNWEGGKEKKIIKPERFKVAYWDKQDNKKQRFKSLKDLNVERVSHDI